MEEPLIDERNEIQEFNRVFIGCSLCLLLVIFLIIAFFFTINYLFEQKIWI
jgi:hypothetical protein